MSHKKLQKIIEIMKFNEQGLIPAIIQDYKTNKVLMLAYMNKEAFLKTIKTQKTHFYSRSRKKLWMKGEESGNIQKVKSIYIDCDNDCVLVKVSQIGKAACHNGYESCFYRKVAQDFNFKIVDKKVFNPQEVYKKYIH